MPSYAHLPYAARPFTALLSRHPKGLPGYEMLTGKVLREDCYAEEVIDDRGRKRKMWRVSYVNNHEEMLEEFQVKYGIHRFEEKTKARDARFMQLLKALPKSRVR